MGGGTWGRPLLGMSARSRPSPDAIACRGSPPRRATLRDEPLAVTSEQPGPLQSERRSLAAPSTHPQETRSRPWLLLRG